MIDRSKPSPSLEQSDALSDDFRKESDQPLSFSRKKMKPHVSTDESSGNSDEETETGVDVSGYRLMDFTNLSLVLSTVHKCDGGESMRAY